MKSIIYSFILFFVFTTFGLSQVTNWQGVLRGADNKPVVDQNVRLRFTILQGGNSVYSEMHQSKTSDLGLINLQVCSGTSPVGSCTNIDPTKGPLMLKVELDDKGGINFKDFGTAPISQSFYSQWANRVVNDAVDDADADPKNELQTLTKQGSKIILSHGGGEVVSGDADPDPTNEIQTLSKQGNKIVLSMDGGSVESGDADADSTNELQMISIQGNKLTISDGNTITIPRSGSDADFDPTNELQVLSKSGDQIELRQGNRKFGVVTDRYKDADDDPGNEIQGLSFNGTVLQLSQANGVDLKSLQKQPDTVWKQTNNSVFWDRNAGSKIEFGVGRFDLIFGKNSEKRWKAGSNNVHERYKFRPSDYPGLELEEGMSMLEFPQTYIKNYHISRGDTSYSITSRFTSSQETRTRMYLESTIQDAHIKNLLFNAAGFGQVFILNPANPNQFLAGMFVDAQGRGTIAANVKAFVVDNPKNENEQIWYACIEGPEAAVYERGTSRLENGELKVNFSDHFASMASMKYTIILTPMSADSKGLAVIEKSADGFVVKELFAGQGNYKFDWEVKAIRKGYEDYKVIRQKEKMSVETLSKIQPITK